MARKHPWLAALAAVVLLSGCAAPYIAEPPAAPLVSGTTALHSSLKHTDATYRGYRAKAIELAQANRDLTNVLLGTGATVLGLSAGRVHSSAIQGATLGGGVIYGFGLLNNDSRRAQIYIEGMAALECAVEAVSPINPRVVDRAAELAKVLPRQANDLSAAIGLVHAAGGPPSEVTAYVDAAKQSLANAVAAMNSVERLVSRSESAANDLNRTVWVIDRSVIKSLEGVDPQMKDVAAAIARLQSYGSIFSAATFTPPALATGGSGQTSNRRGQAGQQTQDSQTDAATPQLREALKRLGETVGAVDITVSGLNGLITGVAEAYKPADLKLCKVAEVAKPAAFTTSPATLIFDEGEAKSQEIVLSGATAPVIARLPAGTKGLEVSEFDAISGTVIVKSTTELPAKPSAVQLSIIDAARHRQIVNITVTPKAPVTGGNTGGGSTGGGANAGGGANPGGSTGANPRSARSTTKK